MVDYKLLSKCSLKLWNSLNENKKNRNIQKEELLDDIFNIDYSMS